VYLCVPYGSHNKQRLFPQTALTGLALSSLHFEDVREKGAWFVDRLYTSRQTRGKPGVPGESRDSRRKCDLTEAAYTSAPAFFGTLVIIINIIIMKTLLVLSMNVGVGIAMCWTARVRFPAVQDVYFLHSFQTDSGGPPSLLSNGYRGLFNRG
jgi:hypothetical protein